MHSLVAASGCCSGVVVVDPTTAELMNSLFRNARIRELSVVVNRIDSLDTKRYLVRALDGAGIRVDAVLGAGPGIAAALEHSVTSLVKERT